MTENNIKAGFKDTEILSYDPESVLSQLDLRLWTPSPMKEITELPDLWVLKTLSNPIEATLQTDFIKN